jgi:hypothetical protein
MVEGSVALVVALEALRVWKGKGRNELGKEERRGLG